MWERCVRSEEVGRSDDCQIGLLSAHTMKPVAAALPGEL
jgi:hypothetical protein